VNLKKFKMRHACSFSNETDAKRVSTDAISIGYGENVNDKTNISRVFLCKLNATMAIKTV